MTGNGKYVNLLGKTREINPIIFMANDHGQFDDFFYLKRMQCRLETKWNSIQSAIEKLVKLTQSVLYLLQFDKF